MVGFPLWRCPGVVTRVDANDPGEIHQSKSPYFSILHHCFAFRYLPSGSHGIDIELSGIVKWVGLHEG
jgi:hypothetical protein